MLSLTALGLIAFTVSTHAATISVTSTANGPSLVVVEGELVFDDVASFQNKIGSIEKAIVIFRSDGGNLLAGLQIGELIRLRNYATLVPNGMRCASACALAWLGGTKRFMGSSALVGFHAAYTNQGGRAAETGVGNALLGAYLNKIGLPYSAVIYITQASPATMTWLSSFEAENRGIDVTVLDESKTSQPLVKIIPDKTRPAISLDTAATEFVITFLSDWSQANSPALGSWLTRIYAEEVFYYGGRTPQQSVISEKLRFAERWPESAYSLRPTSLEAHCSNSLCEVKGIADWKASNPVKGTQSSGAAAFVYGVSRIDGNLKVISENSKVLERQ